MKEKDIRNKIKNLEVAIEAYDEAIIRDINGGRDFRPKLNAKLENESQLYHLKRDLKKITNEPVEAKKEPEPKPEPEPEPEPKPKPEQPKKSVGIPLKDHLHALQDTSQRGYNQGLRKAVSLILHAIGEKPD